MSIGKALTTNKILAFPSDVEAGDRMIKNTEIIASPPDYEDFFIERKFHYSQFGLAACTLSEEICEKFKIKKKTYNDWDPVVDLKQELEAAQIAREKRMEQNLRVANMLFDGQ